MIKTYKEFIKESVDIDPDGDGKVDVEVQGETGQMEALDYTTGKHQQILIKFSNGESKLVAKTEIKIL